MLLFVLLRMMAILLPSETRTLHYIDRVINGQPTFVSRLLRYNQLTLHLLSIPTEPAMTVFVWCLHTVLLKV